MDKPPLPAPMSFDVPTMHYPNVDKEDPTNGKFGLAVPWQSIPEPLASIMGEQIMKAKASSWGLVNLRTARKPRLHGIAPDQSDLVAFRQRIWAMNLSVESMLIGRPATLHVVFWEKTQGRMGGEIGVSLNSIVIDPAKIDFPTPEDEAPFNL